MASPTLAATLAQIAHDIERARAETRREYERGYADGLVHSQAYRLGVEHGARRAPLNPPHREPPVVEPVSPNMEALLRAVKADPMLVSSIVHDAYARNTRDSVEGATRPSRPGAEYVNDVFQFMKLADRAWEDV